MFTSRSNRLIRHLCRCRVRDFSAATTVCAPRMNRLGGSNDPPKPPTTTRPAGEWMPTEIKYSETSLTRSSIPEALRPTVDLEQNIHPKPLPEGSAEAKDLYKALVISSPEEVIRLVEAQHEQMNKVHYALAMKRLFRILRDLEGQELKDFKRELQQQKGFQVLLGLVALKGQYYEADVAADMLRFMCLLGVDSQHPALQVYLQLIKYHLNDLDLHVLVRLMHSLTSLTVTSQTRVLQKAIKVLCNLRVNEVPALNEWQLATLLEHCGDSLEANTLQQILEHLLEETEGISARLSAAIFRGLSKVDAVVLREPPLVELVINMVTLGIDKLHNGITNMATRDIKDVMTSLRTLGIYDTDFYNDVGSHFVKTNSISITDMLSVLGDFWEQSYHHMELVQTFKERLADSTVRTADLSSDQVVQTMRILADASQPNDVLRPESRASSEQEMIQQLCTRVLQNQVDLVKGESEDCLLDMAVLGDTELSEQAIASLKLSMTHSLLGESEDCLLDMAVLGDTELSEQAIASLKLEQQTDTPTQSSSLTASLLLRLYQADFSESLPSVEDHQRDIQDIGRALQLATHQSQSLHVPNKHPLFSIIDYLIVVDSEGCVPTNKDNQWDITRLPEGLTPVAVKVLHDNSYHRNTGQLKGRQLLCGRLVQQEGHLVLFINCDNWRRMDERDMIPYLLRRVKAVHLDQDLHVF